MSERWRYQLRVYLDDDLAEAAYRGDVTGLRPLKAILDAHDATVVSQFKAFEDYVRGAEAEGAEKFPLYKWTKATIENPAMRAKHIGAFAIRVAGEEVYAGDVADRIEHDIKPLVGGEVVKRMSRHDTNPDNNIPVPPAYRS